MLRSVWAGYSVSREFSDSSSMVTANLLTCARSQLTSSPRYVRYRYPSKYSSICHSKHKFAALSDNRLPLTTSTRRARNWNSAGMRIRPPRSSEPSASGASKWAGVDDGRLPSLSQVQMFMAATILEGGCREASGRIHMNSAGGHENSATGYVVAERPLFELSTA